MKLPVLTKRGATRGKRRFASPFYIFPSNTVAYPLMPETFYGNILYSGIFQLKSDRPRSRRSHA